MKYLIVVAHPDDEVLGAGGSIYKWSKRGDIVDVCVMCCEAKARAFRPSDEELDSDMNSALNVLGINRTYEGTFPNIEMNTLPHIKLVQFIEKAIIESQPDIIITHHTSDPNNDHLMTSMACQEAIRLFQRNPQYKPISEFWYMEVGSATDWSINSAFNPYRPDIFCEIGEEGISAKIKALSMYRGVMRPYPHPRSEEAMRGLAAWRGSQAGCIYAESFEAALRRI